MKTIITFGLLLILSVSHAAKINFQKFSSLDKALKASKDAGKPIFFDTYASWCGWCTYMEKNVFNLEEVANYFNENFVCIQVDADNSNATDYSIKYEVSGLPCLLVVDENGEVLSRSDGAITDPDEFIDFGKMAFYKLDPETSPWYKNQKRYEGGERSASFLKEYAMSMLDGEYGDDEIENVVTEYWKNTSNNSLDNEDNFEMFYVFTNDFDDPLLARFIQDKSHMVEEYDEETYYDKLFYVIEMNFTDAVIEDNEDLYNQTLVFAKTHFKNQDIYDYKELIGALEEVWKTRND